MATPVICLGEMLIDFVSTASGELRAATHFARAAGGAPANVAVGLARLGAKSSFVGKVGADAFGQYLRDVLQNEGVDVGGLHFSLTEPTSLAFVSLQENGERDFFFPIPRGADTCLEAADISPQQISQAGILHFGSFSLRHEPARSATLAALEIACEHGVTISFDPNLRPAVWSSTRQMKDEVMQVWQRASLIKVSEEELAFLAGMNDREKAVAQLWHDKLKLLAVTRGAAGGEICTLAGRALVEPFPVTTVDTTGAGDGFVAGLLYSLQDATEISLERARAAGYFANVVGALTTTRRGAIAALPTFDEVRRAMSAKTLL